MKAPPISDFDALDVENSGIDPTNRNHVNNATSDDLHTDVPTVHDLTTDDVAADADATGIPNTPVLPDRANAPVSVVTERFLRAILTYVPLDRIVELHLFSPLRQGATETGIAVIAADIEEPVLDVPVEAPLELSLDQETEALATVEAEAFAEAQQEAGDSVASDALPEIDMLHAIDDDDDVNPYADDDIAMDDSTSVETHDADDTHATPVAQSQADGASASVRDETPVAPVYVAQQVKHIRHTVYTARYRLVLKGPERGRWEIDVVNEADAPLLTVETVVRGVQRRAGEATDTVRYDAAHIARALRLPATPPPALPQGTASPEPAA